MQNIGIFLWSSLAAGLLALAFAWWKALWIDKQDPGTDIGMPGPHHFFNFPNAGFLNLTVNGIQSRYLLPKEITTDDSTGTAKADVLFNFDGTRITLRFEMNDKSPMLYLTLIHDPASDPVKSMEITVLA